MLQRAKLPARMADKPNVYIPIHFAWMFVDQMARLEGIDDFGLRVGSRPEAGISTETTAMVASSPTLFHGIETFCKLAYKESTHVGFWLTLNEDLAQFHYRGSLGIRFAGSRITEWNGIMILMDIVRLFSGRQWYPREINLAANNSVCRLASELFPDTYFHLGQKTASIVMPRRMLSLPPIENGITKLLQAESTPEVNLHGPPEQNFTGSLRQMLPAYLPEGTPHIDLAAEIAGVGTRTLQRKLSQLGTTYSDLVQQVRFESSIDMLENSAIKITDIAYELGYSDPAHFTRAFRRWTCMTPKEYREQRSADPDI